MRGDGAVLRTLGAGLGYATAFGDASSVRTGAPSKPLAFAGIASGSAGTIEGSTGMRSIAKSTALHAE
jgi:hypothetical protein